MHHLSIFSQLLHCINYCNSLSILWFGTCDAGILTDKQYSVIIVSVFICIMIVVIVLSITNMPVSMYLNDCLNILCSLYCTKDYFINIH